MLLHCVGASDSSIDLLPNPAVGSWTKELPTDDGLESDQIFAFDGKTTAIEIPSAKLDFNLGSTFTVSTWMKHMEEIEVNENTHPHGDPKEHILCHSDGEGKFSRNFYQFFFHAKLRFQLYCQLSIWTTLYNFFESFVNTKPWCVS